MMNKPLFLQALSVAGILFSATLNVSAEELKAEAKHPNARVQSAPAPSAADTPLDSLWARLADLHRDSVGESLAAPMQTTLFAQSNSDQAPIQSTR